MKSSRHNLKKGFTLIEIMVAVTIFIVVMVTAIGSILSVTNANRKAQSLNSVMSNLNFAIDTMVRDIRTGAQYDCGGTAEQVQNGSGTSNPNCPTSGQSEISFISSSGQYIDYLLSSNCNKTNDACIEEDIIDPNDLANGTHNTTTSPRVITAVPDMNISSLKFYVRGADQGDGAQPEVLIQIQGKAGITTNTSSTFNIQTLVSQRLLDS